jgi:ATP-binding cassette subfamily F protein uup
MAVALSLVKVSKCFGAQPILQDLTFSLNVGEKVGLIGLNGTGKSTLFKILAKEEDPDCGSVVLTQGLRIAHLPQNPHFGSNTTIRSALSSALIDHKNMIKQHAKIYEILHNASHTTYAQEQLHKELNEVEHSLNRMGWDINQRLKKAQTMWDLKDLDTTIESLSGGWRKRVALAQTWLKNPDVLVMDEPTNHLDQEQVEKIELWLQQFIGTVLLITHDRYLLDNVVDRMLELEKGSVTNYDGSYSDYLLEKAENELLESRLTDQMQNRLRTELTWLNRGAKARTRKSKLRINDVISLKEKVQERSPVNDSITISFTNSSNKSDSLITIEELKFQYANDNKELLGGINLYLQRGHRIAVLGPNGCGKSTFIKLITGELMPTSGVISRHPKLSISSISQGRMELADNLSISENMTNCASIINLSGQDLLIPVFLSKFGFPINQQKRQVSTLSGGERNRLLMAKIMLTSSDLLVLDEPTNDLDIPTLQHLGEALINYNGTLLLVSHDRFFLNQVCTHTLIWNQNGKPRWEMYEGNPITVQRLRAERTQSNNISKELTVRTKTSKLLSTSPIRLQNKLGLTQKEERRLMELELEMEDSYTKIQNLEDALNSANAFIKSDSQGYQVIKDRELAKSHLEELELEWIILEEKRIATKLPS